MIDIVPSCNPVQYQGKLIMQTRENGEKPNFGNNFGSQKFEFYLHYMLHTVTGYHHMKFKGNLMIQTQENGKKPHFGSDLGLLGPNLGSQFFFKTNS